ncbi:MAG: YHYH protein, partial [Opitutales bacterium]
MHPALLVSLMAAASGPPMIIADQQPPAPSRVTITVSGEKRVIEANGVPDHKVSRFPNRGNPHEITEQRYRFEVPLKPAPASGPGPARGPGPGSLWGVALNGVVFDPGTAEIYNDGDRSSPWRYEALLSNTEMGT